MTSKIKLTLLGKNELDSVAKRIGEVFAKELNHTEVSITSNELLGADCISIRVGMLPEKLCANNIRQNDVLSVRIILEKKNDQSFEVIVHNNYLSINPKEKYLFCSNEKIGIRNNKNLKVASIEKWTKDTINKIKNTVTENKENIKGGERVPLEILELFLA